MSENNQFKFSDYDCVGFDLDNTLLRYNIPNMMKMEYETLAKFLVEEKGYSSEFLYKPYELDVDFIQKGLILHFKKGNILKLGPHGVIQKASHGTKMLDDSEIIKYYGEERKWYPTTEFCSDFLIAWNGPLSEEFRTVLDYFDMPAALVFARIIDSIDAKDENVNEYNVWPDMLEGLIHLYAREHFQGSHSEYFEEMKKYPEKYIHKTDNKVIDFVKEMRKTKSTFLITGSHIDFANLTASYALGNNWRDLFDVIICFAKKPGFFTQTRPFYSLDNIIEKETITRDDLKFSGVYSQGNSKDLLYLMNQKIPQDNHKVLYIGDNIVQDVYTPSKFLYWDTITVCEEMQTEKEIPTLFLHPDHETIKSDTWGSYFLNDDKSPTLWAHIITKYSKLCVPNMDILAKNSIDFHYECFNSKNNSNGYHPKEIRIC